MSRVVRVAACAYPVEAIGSMARWRAKLDDLVGRVAAESNPTIAILPEYASMELTSALPETGDLAAQLVAIQALVPDFHAACSAAARDHGVWLVAPSFPEAIAPGTYRNRARVYSPATGYAVVVEKRTMTRFENEHWGISSGTAQVVIATRWGRLGVALCYDAEFPVIVRRLAARGADVIAVPSCTDTIAGYHRVRIAARARALENQLVVALAATVGDAPWSIALDTNVGAAAIFGPPDRGFPDDGVIAHGEVNRPGWVTADVDLDAIAQVRVGGQVLNHRDWPFDDGADPPVIELT
jgi:predicted amidohydrolase